MTRSRPTGATADAWPGCIAPARLVAIRIPEPHEEAVRDPCRARADLVDDRSSACRRLQSLRHGRVYRAGACWTGKHERWLGTQRFDDSQLQATFTHYRAVVATCDAEVVAIEADLAVLGYRAAVRRYGASPGCSPRCRPAGRVVGGRRGRRLAALCPRGRFHGHCCIAPIPHAEAATSLLDQIVKASSSNAMAKRRPAGSSTASS